MYITCNYIYNEINTSNNFNYRIQAFLGKQRNSTLTLFLLLLLFVISLSTSPDRTKPIMKKASFAELFYNITIWTIMTH